MNIQEKSDAWDGWDRSNYDPWIISKELNLLESLISKMRLAMGSDDPQRIARIGSWISVPCAHNISNNLPIRREGRDELG